MRNDELKEYLDEKRRQGLDEIGCWQVRIAANMGISREKLDFISIPGLSFTNREWTYLALLDQVPVELLAELPELTANGIIQVRNKYWQQQNLQNLEVEKQLEQLKQDVEKQLEESRKLEKLIDEMILSSECPVYELAQNRSYYSPSRDQIVLPLRETFKDMESFGKVVFHEMGHSTGHPSRLNRKMGGFFGSPDYSMEELRAELGAMFIESDLNIQLKTENYQDHSDYLKSWLEELEADPNELFRACADAEKIAEYLVGNYEKKYQIPRVLPEEIPDKKGIHKKEKSRTL